MNQNEEIGKRIRFIRRMIGITRQTLSAKYDIEYVTISLWETGKTTITDKIIHQCVQIFLKEGIDCTVDWIRTGNGENPILINSEKSIIEHLKQKETFNQEFQFFLDVESYKENNPASLLHQIKNKAMSPFLSVGDVVGGRKITEEEFHKAHSRKCILSIEDGKFMVRNLFIRKNKFILTADNTTADVVNPLIIQEKPIIIAPINFFRKSPLDEI